MTLVPKNSVDVDAKHVEQILKLTEELEDHDDVQSVSANFNIPTELMEKAKLARGAPVKERRRPAPS